MDAVPAPGRHTPSLRVAVVGWNRGPRRGQDSRRAQRGDGVLRLTHIGNRDIERKKQPWVAERWIPRDVIWTDDFQTILNADVDIVIELIGGLHPAENIVRSALTAGKSVVTANKQLIARHGPDLLQLASANGCQLELQLSVAGGVPVLPALRTGLSGDRLHGIAGILERHLQLHSQPH